MGARPSSFRKGGGKLNGVAALITGYVFTDDIVSFEEGGILTREPFKAGKVKGKDGKVKDRFHSLNAIVSFRVDGAETDMEQPFFAGGADDFAISEDGLTIWDAQYETPEAAAEAALEDPKSVKELGAGTAFAALINSLCEAGFPETLLPEDRINYEPIIGTRVQLVQREDPNMKGQKRKGKNGKEYPYTQTVVDDVLALPEGEAAEEAAPAKTAPKAAAKPAPAAAKTSAKPGTKPTASKGPSIEDQTRDVVLEILGAAKSDTYKVADLSMEILKRRMSAGPARDQMRTIAAKPEFLAGLEAAGLIAKYDKAKKTITRITVEDETTEETEEEVTE